MQQQLVCQSFVRKSEKETSNMHGKSKKDDTTTSTTAAQGTNECTQAMAITAQDLV